MAKSSAMTHRSSTPVGPGEFLATVTKRTVAQPDGSTSLEASIQLDAAPVPDRRYVAESAWVERRGEHVRLVFVQLGVSKDQLRSLLAVAMYPEHVRQFLATCEQFGPSVDTFLSRNAIERPKLAPINYEPAHAVTVIGNLVAAAFSRREAVIDFYHVSPMALRRLNERSDIVLEAVVRVDLATSTLAAILAALKAMEAELPPEAK